MKRLYIIQIGMKLFEVTQNWMMFHLARSWMELLLFGQSQFSRLEFTQIFPIYGNIFNFTQIWMKLSQFAQISLRLLKLPKWFWFYPHLNKTLY